MILIDLTSFQLFPQINTERLLLKQFDISHAKDIYEIRSNDEVLNFMETPKHNTIEESQAFILRNAERYKNKEGLGWAIMLKETNEIIGDFAFWNICHKNARGEIGYSLKRQFWGKGFMSEAMNKTLAFGFKQLKLHSIEANVNPLNKNSSQLLLKKGFQKEAYFRENYYFEGKFYDSEIYCLLEKDLKI